MNAAHIDFLRSMAWSSARHCLFHEKIAQAERSLGNPDRELRSLTIASRERSNASAYLAQANATAQSVPR